MGHLVPASAVVLRQFEVLGRWTLKGDAMGLVSRVTCVLLIDHPGATDRNGNINVKLSEFRKTRDKQLTSLWLNSMDANALSIRVC